MKPPTNDIAPDPILRAGLSTVWWACVHARNASISPDCDVKMINSLMDAIHDIPSQLMTWSPDRLDTLRLHLSCFDSSQYEGAPDIKKFFEERLAEYEGGEAGDTE